MPVRNRQRPFWSLPVVYQADLGRQLIHNMHRAGLILAATSLLWAGWTDAQPGFEPGDVATFADARRVNSVDFTEREVIIGTDRGLWRLDRQTLTLLDPEYFGKGLGVAYPFGRVRAVLYHRFSSTLWIATDVGLFVRPAGLDNWREVHVQMGRIDRLGERGDTLFLDDHGVLMGIAIFGYSDLGELNRTGREGIRWSSGESGLEGNLDLPFYYTVDQYLRFDPDRGRLVDWDLFSYEASFQRLDEEFSRRYIGFPGLGIGVADERKGSLEVFQTGPAGGGFRAIAIGDDGIIYLGGESGRRGEGINSFDRLTGKWERLARRQRRGLGSSLIYDLCFLNGRIYAATEDGLLTGNLFRDVWTNYGLLEGGLEPPVWLVKAVGSRIFIGGRNGVRRFETPGGPFMPVRVTQDADIYAADGVCDGDTLWLVGPQGLFRGGISDRFEALRTEDVIGEGPLRAIGLNSRIMAVGGSNGLQIFDRNRRDWRAMPGKAHFGAGQVISLAIKEDRLYIGTDNGLYQYDSRTGTTLSFGRDQGLPALRVERLLVEADTLWVCTEAGLTRINLNAGYW